MISIAEHVLIPNKSDPGTSKRDRILKRIDHNAHFLRRDFHLNQRDRDVLSEQLRMNASGDDQFAPFLFQFFTKLYYSICMCMLYTNDVK